MSDFPGAIFVIRPDPMRKYFALCGRGGGGLDFLRNFELKIENHANFWWSVFRSRNAYLYPIQHVITSFPSHKGE